LQQYNDHYSSSEKQNNEDNNCDEITESAVKSEPEDEDENEYYLGKDKITKWKINPFPHNICTAQHNIITHLPGVKPHVRNAKTILECWSLFFPENVIQEIVTFTNIYLAQIRLNYEGKRVVLDTSV